MPNIVIPSALRLRHAGLPGEFHAEADTVAEALDALVAAHPGMKDTLFETNGGLRSVIRIFVEEESIEMRQGLETPVRPSEEIFLLPPIAGG